METNCKQFGGSGVNIYSGNSWLLVTCFNLPLTSARASNWPHVALIFFCCCSTFSFPSSDCLFTGRTVTYHKVVTMTACLHSKNNCRIKLKYSQNRNILSCSMQMCYISCLKPPRSFIRGTWVSKFVTLNFSGINHIGSPFLLIVLWPSVASSIESAWDHVTGVLICFAPLFCYCADDHSQLSQDLPFIK